MMMFLSFLSLLLLFSGIVSVVLVVFGVVATRDFFRYVLPLLLVLLLVRLLLAGILLLLNPHFWLFIVLITLLLWLVGKLKK